MQSQITDTDRVLIVGSGALATLFAARLESLSGAAVLKDAKTRLQEYLQGKRRKLPVYRIVSTSGAAHKQVFEVECRVEDPQLSALGQGRSRRAAEQRAAENLLQQLEA